MNENESTSLGKDRDCGTIVSAGKPVLFVSRQTENIVDSLKRNITEDLNDLVQRTVQLNSARDENQKLRQERDELRRQISSLKQTIDNQVQVIRNLGYSSPYRTMRFAEVAAQLPVLPPWPATPDGGHYPTTNAIVTVERKHSSILLRALTNIVNGPLNSREDVRQVAIKALESFSLSPDTPRKLVGEDRIDNKPEIRIGALDAETAKACGDLERDFNKLREKFSGRYHF